MHCRITLFRANCVNVYQQTVLIIKVWKFTQDHTKIHFFIIYNNITYQKRNQPPVK